MHTKGNPAPPARQVLRFLSERLAAARKNSLAPESARPLKKTRPMWVGRLLSVSVDAGLCTMLVSPLLSVLGVPQSIYGAVLLNFAIPFYYLVAERLLGRSIGKIALGYRMVPPVVGSPRGRLLVRGFIRFVPGVNFLLLLSWRRITLLDLVSGFRVQAKEKPSEKPKSRKSPASPSPRGFDKNLLDR